MIKPEIFKNEQLAAFGPWHRLLFIGLWGLADKEGRLEDRPRRIQADIFPYDDGLDMSQMLQDLDGAGFVQRYVVERHGYISLPTFLKHQRPHHTEPASVIPPPPSTPEKVRETPEESGLKEREGKEREEKESKSVSAALEKLSATPVTEIAATPLLVFPTVGTTRDWALTVTQVALWAECYPNLDILSEARQALAWLHANPGRRKTASGMPRFFVNWFNRAVNQGRGTTRVQTAGRPTVAESNLRGLRADLAELDSLERNR